MKYFLNINEILVLRYWSTDTLLLVKTDSNLFFLRIFTTRNRRSIWYFCYEIYSKIICKINELLTLLINSFLLCSFKFLVCRNLSIWCLCLVKIQAYILFEKILGQKGNNILRITYLFLEKQYDNLIILEKWKKLAISAWLYKNVKILSMEKR